MSAESLRIRLITDAFPPRCGGSGWSTYYLGRALQKRGHRVDVLRPRYEEKTVRSSKRVVEYGGLHVTEILVPAAPDWLSGLGMGRAWSERKASRLMSRFTEHTGRTGEPQILHGQHMVSALAASRATRNLRARGKRVVSVATVRDYWPLCPRSTRVFESRDGGTVECSECHRLGSYLSCASKSGVSAALLAPARWANTLAASRSLAGCDAVIAVGSYMNRELARSGRVSQSKITTIPNLVDLSEVDQALAEPGAENDISLENRYLLFVGKLDPNKGPQFLPGVLAQQGVSLPVVFAGTGPLKASLEREARARGLDFRFYDWLDNSAVLKLMRSARALLFPSAWQEPLSRVLLEGCAAGAAIVALDTGGSSDIIQDGQSGWLAHDLESFGRGTRRLVDDDALNTRLRAGARRQAEEKFSADKISAEVEALYRRLLAG